MTTLSQSRLELQPNALAVRAVGGWLKAATDQLEPDAAADVFPRAELAVHEACMNVIDHANLPEGGVIELSLVLSADRPIGRVTDRGDVFELPGPTVRSPGELSDRGYGLRIIRSLVSEIAYERIGSGNHLELRIDIRSSGQ